MVSEGSGSRSLEVWAVSTTEGREEACGAARVGRGEVVCWSVHGPRTGWGAGGAVSSTAHTHPAPEGGDLAFLLAL